MTHENVYIKRSQHFYEPEHYQVQDLESGSVRVAFDDGHSLSLRDGKQAKAYADAYLGEMKPFEVIE